MRIRPFLFLLPFLICAGSRPSGGEETPIKPGAMHEAEIQEANERLRADVRQFEEFVTGKMDAASAAIAQESGKKKTRKTAEEWESLVVSLNNEALKRDPALGALLDAWALNEQILAYLVSGDGRGLFDAQLHIALATAGEIRDEAMAITGKHLDEERLKQAKENIQLYVSQNPLKKKSFFSGLFDITDTFFSVVDIGKNTLSTVASVPLMPGRAAQGIQKGTAEFAHFNETAERFTRIIEKMPEQTRLEMEQLLTRLEDSYTTLGPLMRDIRDAAGALETMMAAADSVSTNVQTVLVNARESAPEFSKTADSVTSAAQALRALTDSVAGLVERTKAGSDGSNVQRGSSTTLEQRGNGLFMDSKEYREAAQAIGAGAEEVRLVMEEIRWLVERPDKKNSPAQEKGRPFDVREYTDTARAIQGAADRVHAILADARGMGQGGEMTSASLALQQSLTGIMDRAALRLVQVLAAGALLVFVLTLVLLLIHHRLKQARNNR